MEYLKEIFTVTNLLMMNLGMAAGIIIGALPGLSALLAVTVVLPFTFGMESLPGMYLLLGTYCGATYGGSITAIPAWGRSSSSILRTTRMSFMTAPGTWTAKRCWHCGGSGW